LFLSFFFLSACVSLRAKTQQPNPADGFLARSYRNAGGETMQYRLFVPPGYAAAKKYPIMLWLHGANGRGSDNRVEILLARTFGLRQKFRRRILYLSSRRRWKTQKPGRDRT
jgi:poly(3-hydroxybutyrate) depolymerase